MQQRLLMASLVLVAVGSADCEASNSTGSDTTALASRGRASLLATFTGTPFRLHAKSDARCATESVVGGSEADDRAAISCALTGSVMGRLEQHMDKGFGSDITAAQKSCINRRLTRGQVAALLSGRFGVGRPHASAAVADFDRQLASIIAGCIAH